MQLRRAQVALTLGSSMLITLLLPVEASHRPFHESLCVYGDGEPTCIDPEPPTPSPAMYLVGFKVTAPGVPGGVYCGATISSVNSPIQVMGVRTLDEPAFKACASSDPNVEYVEPDGWFDGDWPDDGDNSTAGSQNLVPFIPNDPYFLSGDQYGPVQVKANLAWRNGLGGLSATLCIVDTGFRRTHEDLEGNWLGGYDFINNDDEPEDENGHGTKMAGIAAGRIDNALGMAGLGNVALYGVKVRGPQGFSKEAIERSITWCVDNAGPRTVISMSFYYGSESSPAILDAIRDAQTRGALLVAAAGNCYLQNPACTDVRYPALHEEVIAVAATGPGSVVADCSAHHPKVELAAPGKGIFSTTSDSDESYTSSLKERVETCGTSDAAAMVSGGAALFWSQHPEVDNTGLRERLGRTAFPAGYAQRNEYLGHGEIDLDCLFKGTIWPCPV